MPAYKYEAARAVGGGIERGVVDADSARQARTVLRERGLVPLAVAPLEERPVAGATTVLAARLPLERALAVVIEQAERTLVRDRLAAVRSEVVAGQTLARALAKYPRDFPEVYRALVAAGEQSGDLSRVMSRLADYVESRTALTQRVKLAFTYPVIVTLVAVAVVVALLTYVVPQVVGVFAQTKQTLPWLTRALIAVSSWVRHGGLALVVLALAAGWLVRMLLKSPSARQVWHRRLLSAPVLGRLVRGLNTARFASTLAILTGSGVPLIRALEAGAQTLGNEAMRANVADAVVRVREGVPLSRALAAGGLFPPVMIHMIASGEATGELPEMLERTAQTLSGEVERRTLALTTLLEPMLILGMGAVVLVIVLAVLLPIIELNQLVR